MTKTNKIKALWHALWLPLLSIALTCFYPCVFLYSHNVQEASFGSMFPFFRLFLVNALLFWAVFALILRSPSSGGFLADLAMLVVINFTLILTGLQKRFPSLQPKELLLILTGILLALLIFLLVKKFPMRIPCVLICLMFGSLSAMCLISAAVFHLTSSDTHEVVSKAFESYEPKTFSSENRPNVYFFLYDGYGGVENLQHYYDYDNEPFMKDLEERVFPAPRKSHNTESLKTVTLIPDLMNMDYLVHKEMTTKERDALLVMPNLFRTFADNGYQLNLINHLDYFGAEGCHVLTHSQSRQTISDFLLAASIYSQDEDVKAQVNKWIKADYVANYRAPLLEAIDAEKTCWQDVGVGPTFTLGYIQCPHAPTILDKDGNLVDDWQHSGWEWDKSEYYLGQLEFVSSQILEIVDAIQAHDPDALIILQSDHGCRLANHYYDMGLIDTFDPKVENPYMQNILNCVYYKGQTFSIEGMTGINTIRTILNDVFGTDYEMLKPKKYLKGTFESS